MKILVINPGSTSTKLAVYEDNEQVWRKSVFHSAKDLSVFHHINEQYEYRRLHVTEALREAGIPLCFDAIIARGGLLKPTPGGVYRINERIKHDLWHADMEHASNLAALIADELAASAGCPAFIADPVVTDELCDVARLTGIPEIPRISIFHALNSRAVSRNYAARIGKKYEELNLIVVHLGGGISVSAHHYGKVIDVNNALNGEGPFSPERAGTIPARQLVDLCFSGKYTYQEIRKMLAYPLLRSQRYIPAAKHVKYHVLSLSLGNLGLKSRQVQCKHKRSSITKQRYSIFSKYIKAELFSKTEGLR